MVEYNAWAFDSGKWRGGSGNANRHNRTGLLIRAGDDCGTNGSVIFDDLGGGSPEIMVYPGTLGNSMSAVFLMGNACLQIFGSMEEKLHRLPR